MWKRRKTFRSIINRTGISHRDIHRDKCCLGSITLHKKKIIINNCNIKKTCSNRDEENRSLEPDEHTHTIYKSKIEITALHKTFNDEFKKKTHRIVLRAILWLFLENICIQEALSNWTVWSFKFFFSVLVNRSGHFK